MSTVSSERDRGAILLEAICDDVDRSLNPDGDECWHCGGDGATYDCIDGCCVDPESGCSLCARPCLECKIHNANRAKAVRLAVIESGDTDVAIAWLKSIGRWRDGIPVERVASELAQALAARPVTDREELDNGE
jgi:hypothetical protein